MARNRFPAACAALLVALVAVPVSADPVAVIAAVKGRVQVLPARTRAAARAVFGRPLERGDKVSVGAGGAATVFFSDGNVVELAEKSSVTIGGRAESKAVAGGGLPGEVYSQVSKFVTTGSRRTGLVAISEVRGSHSAEGGPVIVSPRRTSVLEAQPVFYWRTVEGASRYRVRLASADGRELWMRETPATALEYPADAKPLAADAAYGWTVEALAGDRLQRAESVEFRVASDELARSVRGNVVRIQESAGGEQSAASRYLIGSYFAGLGLYRDAADSFGALIRLSPESPTPHEALGNVYSRVGLMDLAAAEYEQALALAREP